MFKDKLETFPLKHDINFTFGDKKLYSVHFPINFPNFKLVNVYITEDLPSVDFQKNKNEYFLIQLSKYNIANKSFKELKERFKKTNDDILTSNSKIVDFQNYSMIKKNDSFIAIETGTTNKDVTKPGKGPNKIDYTCCTNFINKYFMRFSYFMKAEFNNKNIKIIEKCFKEYCKNFRNTYI